MYTCMYICKLLSLHSEEKCKFHPILLNRFLHAYPLKREHNYKGDPRQAVSWQAADSLFRFIIIINFFFLSSNNWKGILTNMQPNCACTTVRRHASLTHIGTQRSLRKSWKRNERIGNACACLLKCNQWGRGRGKGFLHLGYLTELTFMIVTTIGGTVDMQIILI